MLLPSPLTSPGSGRRRPLARILSLAALAALLLACANHQPAPVTEAGQPLPVRPPIIVESGQSSAPVSRDRPTVVDSGSQSTTRSSAAGGASTHTVQRGDTLFSIAFQYDLDFRQLAIANDLNPPYTIFVGQELNLDTSRVVSNARSPAGNVGTPVNDNAVARTRAGSSRSGVIRQSIEELQREPVWQWPLRGRVLRGFAAGIEGLDIAASVGDPVRAAEAGDVVYAGQGIQGAGNLLILRHNDRFLSAYGHNSRLLVGEGDHVEAGQQIAEVGQNAAGTALLHFEIRREGSAVDPIAYLPAR